MKRGRRQESEPYRRGTVPCRQLLFRMDTIYLDNNATAPMLPEVWEAMRPYFLDISGNPASSHRPGRLARQALEDARDNIAQLLDAHADEVLFHQRRHRGQQPGSLRSMSAPHPPIFSAAPSNIPASLSHFNRLVEQGFSHDTLPVSDSRRRFLATRTCSRPDTRLVAVMLANHETGTIEPIAELVRQVAGRALFHCDAAAAAGKIPSPFAAWASLR